MSNLNVPADVLSIIQTITSSANFDLPDCLREAAKKAAAEAAPLYIFEDRCSCHAKHFHEAVEANKIDWTAQTVEQYNRAIDHFSQGK